MPIHAGRASLHEWVSVGHTTSTSRAHGSPHSTFDRQNATLLGLVKRAHVMGATAVAIGLVTANAQGDEEPPPARLRLEVEAECTNGADFAGRIRARSSRIDAGQAADATLVAVTIAPATSGERIEGTMRVGESIRHVEGATCEEVADALSLVAVLTFDPEAGGADPAPPSPVPTPPPPPPERPAPSRSPLGPAPAAEGWRFGLGLHGVAAAIDEVPLGASIVGEMARGRELSTLTFRLAFTTYGARVEEGTRAANLIWAFLVPQVCPLRVHTGPLSLFPCAGVAMGVLSSEPTRGVVRPKSFTRAWVAPRGAVRARVALAPRLGLEVEAALDVPIIRDRYAFGANEAYRVPVVAPAVGVGIAMELP